MSPAKLDAFATWPDQDFSAETGWDLHSLAEQEQAAVLAAAKQQAERRIQQQYEQAIQTVIDSAIARQVELGLCAAREAAWQTGGSLLEVVHDQLLKIERHDTQTLHAIAPEIACVSGSKYLLSGLK